jgi:hypothetical protein
MASRSYTTPGRTGKASQSKAGVNPEYVGKQSGMKHVASTTPTTSGVKPNYIANLSSGAKAKSTTPTMSSARKRKLVERAEDEDEDEDDFAAALAYARVGTTKAKRPRKQKGEEPDEKRLRRHRAKAPGTYLERLLRVRTQRMFLIDRTRTLSADGSHEEEVFDIAGSTGNVYQVTISKIPDCTCPDASKGNQCKHIIYVSVFTCLFHDYPLIQRN